MCDLLTDPYLDALRSGAASHPLGVAGESNDPPLLAGNAVDTRTTQEPPR